MYRPTMKSKCSGGGFSDYGFSLAGIEIIQSLEIDLNCVKTLQANYNHKILHSDIRNETVLSQERSDIIAATYPCTTYSTIADIHGTRTGDDLFLHVFRHIAIEQPEMYIIENVPGMKKFPVVMEAMTRLPNYYINIFCPLDALNWLPQKRERLILIGTKRRFNIAPPTSTKRILLSDIIDEIPDMKVPDYVVSRINGKYRDKPIISDPSDKDSYAPTCVAHYSKDRGTRLVVDKSHPLGVRPYSVREWARLQGIPDSYILPISDSEAYKQIGNGVPVHMAEWIGRQAIKYFN